MARPEVEWPIPIYVTELRERVVMTFRIPPRALVGRVPAPLIADLAAGGAVAVLALANGRCLKPVGGVPVLASEFHTAELVTPVVWQGACRPPVRGLFLLRLLCDSTGLARLVRAALEFETEPSVHYQGTDRAGYGCRAEASRCEADAAALRLPSTAAEEPWPAASAFSSHEAAEAHLMHPACYFVPDRGGRAVQAVPVHQYARCTTHVRASGPHAALVARTLGQESADVELDHVFFQKRCTHTWAYPPERIPVAAPLSRWVLA